MNTILLGGTKGIGRALAREIVEAGNLVFLIGRDPDELERSAADLRARHPQNTEIGWGLCDLEDPSSFEKALTLGTAYLGRLHTVVVTAGLFALQEDLEEDTELARRLLTVNFANTVTFCEYARKRLLKQGGGTLCVLSSVAGDRGRKPVALYGASKAGLSHYLESLDHKYRDQGLTTICVKPGFVRTSMTAGLKAPPFAGNPEDVAKTIYRAIEKGSPLVYTPAMWGVVMAVIRRLPRSVMRRINF